MPKQAKRHKKKSSDTSLVYSTKPRTEAENTWFRIGFSDGEQDFNKNPPRTLSRTEIKAYEEGHQKGREARQTALC